MAPAAMNGLHLPFIKERKWPESDHALRIEQRRHADVG
jgi:hypothetical protein